MDSRNVTETKAPSKIKSNGGIENIMKCLHYMGLVGYVVLHTEEEVSKHKFHTHNCKFTAMWRGTNGH